MQLSTPLFAVASLLFLSTATLVLWNRAGAQTTEEEPYSKREIALRQRCIELFQRNQLDSFFTRIDKARDSKKKTIEGVAEVETTDRVISMRVVGLAEYPKRQLRAGDTFKVLDRHFSITYRIVKVDHLGILFDFDANIHLPQRKNKPFAPELGSGKGQVQLYYRIPYLDAKP